METVCHPEDVGLVTKRLARIDAWIQRYLDSGKLPGATILVARHGQVSYCKSFGFRNMEAQELMTSDTIAAINPHRPQKVLWTILKISRLTENTRSFSPWTGEMPTSRT